ncbi:MAG: hypothetical protein ABFS35_17825 [Bacteroidota bacterium]
MEFTKEFIEEHKLDENQVKGITDFANDQVATLKKDWDSKANSDAEKILQGAITYTQSQTGFNLERQQGEKAGDYFNRFSDSYLSGQKADLDKAKSDYEEKMKGVKGNETLSAEYEKLKVDNDNLLKKYANYDELKEKAEKAEAYGTELSGLKLEVAFNGVKPNFPETVNKYEAAALWNEFKNEVLSKNTIEIVDNVPMAVDKENKHKIVKLSDLLTKNEPITKLLEGRKQDGTGAKQINLTDIEGVPFKVPDKADAATRSKLIKEHLTKIGISNTDPKFADEFAKLNKAIQTGKTQTA